jgi:hypothetical protein
MSAQHKVSTLKLFIGASCATCKSSASPALNHASRILSFPYAAAAAAQIAHEVNMMFATV